MKGLSELSHKYIAQVPAALFYGAIPTLIIYLYSNSQKEFIKNLKEWIPIKPLIYYFSILALISMGMLFFYRLGWYEVRHSKKSKFLAKLLDVLLSPLKAVFQMTSGLFITLPFISFINDGYSANNIKLSVIIFVFSFLFLLLIAMIDVFLESPSDKLLSSHYRR